MTVHAYLTSDPLFSWLPCSMERPAQRPTKSEVRRWCRTQSVLINGTAVAEDDTTTFPVTDLVFFPKSLRRKTTLYHAG